MATIENLGAYFIRMELPARADRPEPNKLNLETNRAASKATARARVAAHAVAKAAIQRATVERTEEVEHRETSIERGRAHERTQPRRQMSLEELAEMLRKVNLTFDLFEIQARIIVDQKTGDISVEVINQRTGEVIRKIPPYDVTTMVESLETGDSVLTDVEV